MICFNAFKISVIWALLGISLVAMGNGDVFGDKEGTGKFAAEDMVQPPKNKWSIKIKPRGYPLPAVVNKEHLYLSNSFGDISQHELATGKFIWKSKSVNHIFGNNYTVDPPSFYGDKGYLGRNTEKGYQHLQPSGLYVFDQKTGKPLKTLFKNQFINNVLRIDSTLFVEVNSGKPRKSFVYALDLNTEKVLWKSEGLQSILGLDFIADDNNLYLASFTSYTGSSSSEGRIINIYALSRATGSLIWVSDPMDQPFRVSAAKNFIVVSKSRKGIILVDKKTGRFLDASLFPNNVIHRHVTIGNSILAEFDNYQLGSFDLISNKYDFSQPFIPRPRLNWYADFFATDNYIYSFVDGMSAYSLGTGKQVWSTPKIVFREHYAGHYTPSGKYLTIQQYDDLKAYSN